MCPGISSFSNENGSPPFFLTATSPPRNDNWPWVCPPVTLYCTLLSIPNSSLWWGSDSWAVLWPSGAFFWLISFILLWWLFLICWLPFLTPFPPLSSALYFSAQKNLTSIPKKMKLQKLKFKKNLKKNKKILDDSFSFINIFHCFLRLVSCSL